MTPKQVLEEARRLIAEEGWAQGSFNNQDGAGCAYGACVRTFYKFGNLRTDFNNFEWKRVVYRESLDALRDSTGTDNILKWNDDPDRTKEQVLEAFDRAIASVE